VSKETQEVIASYLTDMLALEEHMNRAFTGQLADMKGGRGAGLISQLKTTSEEHSRTLHDLADSRTRGGQGIAEVVKKAASSVLGMGAAAIDFVRSDEKVPKNLRDDYAAICLASVGYLMLHTTAVTLNDSKVADLAFAHLRDYAKASMTLFNIVPEAVVEFLGQEGFPVHDDVAAKINDAVDEIWASGATRGA
jgi:hypothetical protein